MKKTLLFLLLAVATAPAAFAQARPGGSLSSKDYTGGKTTDSRNTGFGVKGGYSLSNFYGGGQDAFNGRSSLNTFHAGVYGQFGFNDFSSVQVELLYSRKGIRSNYNNAGLSDLRLDYLSLPILYVGNITDNISFHIGPEVSLLTKVSAYGKDLDLNDNGFNNFDIAGVAGLEARIGPARVGARYDLGLARVIKEGRSFSPLIGATGNDTKFHNQTFQVYVGIGLTQ
ncbi:outer membrane beta-barrel protein [Hymenobacter terricola]|uniref:outer membrane beta-barrel protein n=1 Tax=Hymenobacter terricola TaxID=2819236 RepID=UPI001B31019E|nr:outer membrane beta-barrel protein [Hymenobacter terricola]